MAYDENGLIVPDPIPATDVIDNVYNIPKPASTESSHPVLQQLKDEISSLQADLAKALENEQFYRNLSANRARETDAVKNSLKDVLTQKFNEGELDSEVAKYIAEACEVELTRYVTISGNITFSGEVEVSMFEQFDEIAYNMSVDSIDISYDGEALGNLDYDVESADYEENN